MTTLDEVKAAIASAQKTIPCAGNKVPTDAYPKITAAEWYSTEPYQRMLETHAALMKVGFHKRNPETMHEVVTFCEIVRHHGGGSCRDMAMLALEYLLCGPHATATSGCILGIFRGDEDSHAIALVDLPPDKDGLTWTFTQFADLQKPPVWVADPWADIGTTADDYPLDWLAKTFEWRRTYKIVNLHPKSKHVMPFFEPSAPSEFLQPHPRLQFRTYSVFRK